MSFVAFSGARQFVLKTCRNKQNLSAGVMHNCVKSICIRRLSREASAPKFVKRYYPWAGRFKLPAKCEVICETIPKMYVNVHRHFSLSLIANQLSDADMKKSIDLLTDKFMEARELMDDARESEGTVYFSDDMKDAQDAVVVTLQEYKNLLTKLSEKQKQEVLRSIGLKMEELKAQLAVMEEELKEEH